MNPTASKVVGDGLGMGGSMAKRKGDTMPHLKPAQSSKGGTTMTGNYGRV